MRFLLFLLLMPFFAVLLSAALCAPTDLQENSLSSVLEKINTGMANAGTEEKNVTVLTEAGTAGSLAINSETLHSFSVTEWGRFTESEKIRFAKAALPVFELAGQAVLDSPKGFVSTMDARCEEFLADGGGLSEHTDLSELSLFNEMAATGQKNGQLKPVDDH